MADISLIPASAEGGVIEILQKEVQGVPGTTDQPLLSFYGLDTELFDVDVYVVDATGSISPAATTRGLGISTSSGPSTPAPGPGTTYTAGAGIDITGNVISATVAPIWAYVGDPTLQSISLGPLDLASNAFDLSGLNEANVFYAGQFVVNNTVGADFSGNLVYGQFSDNTIGANCHSNTFRGAFTFNKVGNNVNSCYFDLDTSYTEIGDGCERVTLFNCRGTPQQPFVVPPGTVDAEFRNNLPVTRPTSGLPTTATRTAAYTLALTDADHLVPVSSASAVTVTVPAHADVPFPVGTTLYVARDGAGAVSIAGASGVMVQTADGYQVGGQWLDVALHKRNLNTWVLKGGVS